MPAAPVSEIVGKYSALARRRSARWRRSACLLGLQQVGPALEQRPTARPRAPCGSASSYDRLAARDRSRVAADQHRQRVLGLRDLRFDQRNLRGRRLVLRLHLRRPASATPGRTGTAACTGAPIRRRRPACACATASCSSRPRSVQVVARDRRHQRQDHAAARLVGGQQVRARGFAQAADAAPQVDLPARAAAAPGRPTADSG